jgi:hypothetical protein
MNYTNLIIALAVWTAISLAFAIGFNLGRKRGQDEQWVSDYIEHGRNQAARRDSQGRFRSMAGGN